MKKLILLTAIFLISVLAYSQSEFQVRYSNHQNSQAKQIIKLAGKKTLLCSDFNNASGYGISLLCLDSNYYVIWYKEILEQTISLNINDVIEAANGDILLAATAGISGDNVTMLLRWSSDGQLLWNKYYQDSTFMYLPRSIQELPSAELLILGKEEIDPFTFDSFLLKTDANGSVISRVTFDHTIRSTNFTKFFYQPNGNKIFYGTLANGNLESYVVSATIDSNGTLIDKNLIPDIEYANTGNHYIIDAVKNKGSNSYTVTGYHTDSVNYKSVGLFVSDSAGVYNSVYGFRVDSNLIGYTKITATSDSGFAVTGILPSPYSVCLVKFDKNYNPQFARRYAIDQIILSEGNIAPQETADHGFLIATENNIVIKTDSAGRTTCGNDTLMNVSVNFYNKGNVLAQLSMTSGTMSEYTFPLTANDLFIVADSLCLPVAIEKNFMIEDEVSPQPAVNFLNVKTANEMFDRAVLISIEGKTIPLYSSSVMLNEIKLNVESVTPGFYILILSNSGKNILNKKVLISR